MWEAENKERLRQYRATRRELHAFYNRRWARVNVERVSANRKRLRLQHLERERQRDRVRYQSDPQRKLALVEYRKSNPEKVKQGIRRWAKSPEGRQKKYAWTKTSKGLVHADRRTRMKTAKPSLFLLNSWFPQSHLHHVEESIGIFVPKELHSSVRHNLKTGNGMADINSKIADWLAEANSNLAIF